MKAKKIGWPKIIKRRPSAFPNAVRRERDEAAVHASHHEDDDAPLTAIVEAVWPDDEAIQDHAYFGA